MVKDNPRLFGRTPRLPLAIAGLLMLAACGSEDAAAPEPTVRPAKLFQVEEALNARTTNFPAVIKARSSAELTFEVSGVLEVFPVEEGQEVTKGDLIAQLEQRAFENDVAQAEAQYKNAAAQFNRAAQLIDKGTIARSTYDTRLKDRDVAKTALDNAQKRLDDSTMRAPFDGVIATKHVDQFQTIAQQTPIVTIQSTGAAEAVVQIPSRMVANSNQIEPIETLVILDAAPDISIPAALVSTSAQTDPRTQTFEVNFAFEPPEELTILPGMTGTLRARLAVSGRDGESHMTIPRTAVLPRGGTLYVWKVDPDSMTVSQQAIETGPWLEEGIPVTAGLEPGDVIIEAGVSYLAEGMKVRPYSE